MFGCGGSSVNDDPDDFTGELCDFERMVHGRTAISLWDPTARDGVVRTHEDTRVHIPKLDALGGEGTRVGDWYVYRLGDAYLAYLPLGTVAAEEDRGDYVYLRLDGRSGGIRLEYRPERRVIAGAELSMDEALGHGLMESPWVSWDPATQVMRVARDCYPSRVYDWANKTITEEPPPADCAGGSGGAGGGASGGAGPGGSGGSSGSTQGDGAPGDEEGGCGCVSVGRRASGLQAFPLLLPAIAVMACWRRRWAAGLRASAPRRVRP